MKLHRLGQTDCKVSQLALGTVKLGRNEKVKYPSAFELPSDQQVTELLNCALDVGVNLIDTAPAYGESESRLGRLLPGKREDWHIMTKVGEEFIGGQSEFNFTPEYARYSVERSLKHLRTDYLDIVLVHSDGNDIQIIKEHGVLQALMHLKQEGLIRAVGMSCKTVEGGLLAVEESDCVMVTCNVDDNSNLPVLQRAKELNKGVLIKKALSSGHACLKGDDAVKRSFDFVFSQPAVTSVVVGTLSPEHLRHNAQCF
jgi:aryl-alcohol dehydrogenase-like predicted oxidoreductase